MSTTVENTPENIEEVTAVIGFLTLAREKMSEVTGWTKRAEISTQAYLDDGHETKQLADADAVCLIGSYKWAIGASITDKPGATTAQQYNAFIQGQNTRAPYYRMLQATAATIIDNQDATIRGTIAVLETKYNTSQPELHTLEAVNTHFNDAGTTTKHDVLNVLDQTLTRLTNLLTNLNNENAQAA